MLRLDALNGNWDWDIYLYVNAYKDMKQYPRSLPFSKKQTDVAAVADVSVIGIALLNIMTKTSLTGFVSMNTPSTPLPDSAVKKAAGKPGGFFDQIY